MTGKVVKISGSLALVEQSEKESPCDMCKSPCIQKDCKRVKKVNLWAENPVNAGIGDTVNTAELKNGSSLLFGILCFALPTAFAALCFMLTLKLSEGFRILAAFVGFAVCEAICVSLCSALSKRFPALEIIGILKDQEQQIKNGEL